MRSTAGAEGRAPGALNRGRDAAGRLGRAWAVREAVLGAGANPAVVGLTALATGVAFLPEAFAELGRLERSGGPAFAGRRPGLLARLDATFA